MLKQNSPINILVNVAKAAHAANVLVETDRLRAEYHADKAGFANRTCPTYGYKVRNNNSTTLVASLMDEVFNSPSMVARETAAAEARQAQIAQWAQADAKARQAAIEADTAKMIRNAAKAAVKALVG